MARERGLTAIQVERAARSRQPEMLLDGGGLYLRKQKAHSSVSWTLRYQFAGSDRWMKLGSYPDMSLADARKVARAARVKLDHDRDPLSERRAEREAYRRRGTFRQLAEDWFSVEVASRLKHPEVPRRYLDRHLLPKLGTLRAGEVTTGDILALVDPLRADSPAAANDVIRFARRIFDFGVRRRLVQHNPAGGLSPRLDGGGTERSRTRALSRDELERLFRSMRTTPGFSGTNALAVKLLLALCVRKGELIAARWEEFDLHGENPELGPVWQLPATRTKTGTGLNIPLSVQVVEWLRALEILAAGSEYVFPQRRRDARSRYGHVGRDTLNAALKSLNHGLDHFTVHDMRRTARTHLAALGVRSEIAERCLGHKLRGVEGTYNTHDYYTERRDVLTTWAGLLCEFEHGRKTVVPLRRA
jgi:integrase